VRAFTELTVGDRVAFRAAVRRLDRVAPGWRDRVNPATLCMYDGEHCVLGQLFGGYHAGLVALEQRLLPDVHDHAFTADFPVAPWLAELARHRVARPVDDRDPVGVA
jgi:hypothetical protein